jgi:hypothetical protein
MSAEEQDTGSDASSDFSFDDDDGLELIGNEDLGVIDDEPVA